jgi:hypothetical protein
MIDTNSKFGRNDPLAVLIYLYSYLIAYYKFQILLTKQITVKLFLILWILFIIYERIVTQLFFK